MSYNYITELRHWITQTVCLVLGLKIGTFQGIGNTLGLIEPDLSTDRSGTNLWRVLPLE